MRSLLVIIFIILFTGCSKEPQVQPKLKEYWSDKRTSDDILIDKNLTDISLNVKNRKDFPVAQYNALRRMGFATISGYVENRLKYKSIMLEPVTSYTKEWYKKSVKDNVKLEIPDNRVFHYAKLAISDKDGKFTFHNVPVGKYYMYIKIDNYFLVNVVEIKNSNDTLEHNLTKKNKPFYLY